MTEIKCPKCRVKPRAYDRWKCDKCRFGWHTFDTFGQCPRCGHVHKQTRCFVCKRISPHIDWYTDPDDNIEEIVKEILEAVPEEL
jgi:hypothetical protein